MVGWISDSAGIPNLACSRRIISIVNGRLRLITSDTRLLLLLELRSLSDRDHGGGHPPPRPGFHTPYTRLTVATRRCRRAGVRRSADRRSRPRGRSVRAPADRVDDVRAQRLGGEVEGGANPLGRLASVGQLGPLPVQLSATSHSPTEGRQTIDKASATPPARSSPPLTPGSPKASPRAT